MRRLLLLLGLVAVVAGSTSAGAATTTVTITKTGFHAFNDHGTLELREHAKHLKQRAAGRRAGVDGLLVEV